MPRPLKISKNYKNLTPPNLHNTLESSFSKWKNRLSDLKD